MYLFSAKEQNQDALAVFDRCVIGYIMYLKKEFGKSFSDDLFNRPDILKNTQWLAYFRNVAYFEMSSLYSLIVNLLNFLLYNSVVV